MANPRIRRIDELVRSVVGEKLLELKDPRLGFVTVTDVRTTKDLAQSEIFFTVLPDDAETRDRTIEGLNSARPLLRRKVGEALQTRVTPDLVFTPDPIPAQGRRIEELLAAGPGSDGSDGPAAQGPDRGRENPSRSSGGPHDSGDDPGPT